MTEVKEGDGFSMDLSERIKDTLGDFTHQTDVGRLYMERQKAEKVLITLNRDIVGGKKELIDEEVDEAFREYNRLGRMIAEAEKAEPGKGA